MTESRRPMPNKRRRPWNHRPWRRGEEPREPFFKDARALHGRVRLDVSLRALLIGIVAFVGVATATGYYLVDANDKINGAISQLNDLRKSGRHDRLKAETEIRAQVRDLACFLWNFVVASPKPESQIVAQKIDAKYACVLLYTPRGQATKPGAAPSHHAPLVPRSPTPRASGTKANTAPRSSTHRRASSAPRASRSPTPRASAPAPRPSPSSTPTAPKSKPIVDLNPILCKLKLSKC